MTIKLIAPQNHGDTVSVAGQVYKITGGAVEVPEQYALSLYAFGYSNPPASLATPADSAPPKAKAAPAASVAPTAPAPTKA
jgi:hypothetical protein